MPPGSLPKRQGSSGESPSPQQLHGGFNGGLGPRRLCRAFHLRPCCWAGFNWTLRSGLWVHLRSAARRPFPLLGTRGGTALLLGSVLFVINNNIGGDSLAPGA